MALFDSSIPQYNDYYDPALIKYNAEKARLDKYEKRASKFNQYGQPALGTAAGIASAFGPIGGIVAAGLGLASVFSSVGIHEKEKKLKKDVQKEGKLLDRPQFSYGFTDKGDIFSKPRDYQQANYPDVPINFSGLNFVTGGIKDAIGLGRGADYGVSSFTKPFSTNGAFKTTPPLTSQPIQNNPANTTPTLPATTTGSEGLYSAFLSRTPQVDNYQVAPANNVTAPTNTGIQIPTTPTEGNMQWGMNEGGRISVGDEGVKLEFAKGGAAKVKGGKGNDDIALVDTNTGKDTGVRVEKGEMLVVSKENVDALHEALKKGDHKKVFSIMQEQIKEKPEVKEGKKGFAEGGELSDSSTSESNPNNIPPIGAKSKDSNGYDVIFDGNNWVYPSDNPFRKGKLSGDEIKFAQTNYYTDKKATEKSNLDKKYSKSQPKEGDKLLLTSSGLSSPLKFIGSEAIYKDGKWQMKTKGGYYEPLPDDHQQEYGDLFASKEQITPEREAELKAEREGRIENPLTPKIESAAYSTGYTYPVSGKKEEVAPKTTQVPEIETSETTQTPFDFRSAFASAISGREHNEEPMITEPTAEQKTPSAEDLGLPAPFTRSDYPINLDYTQPTPTSKQGFDWKGTLGDAAATGFDLYRLGAGLEATRQPIPEFHKSAAWIDLVNRMHQQSLSGLTPAETALYSQSADRQYGADVANIYNLSGGNAGLALANLGRANMNRYQSGLQLAALDRNAMNQNLAQYGSILGQDVNLDRMIFGDKYNIAMMNKQAGAQLANDAIKNMFERGNYNQEYGRGSLYNQLQLAQLAQMNEATQAIKAQSDYWANWAKHGYPTTTPNGNY